MTTAKDIVNQSLKLCNEFSRILAIDPYVQQEGFTALVDMLVTMRGDGMYVTPQIPASINDDLKELPWAKKGIIYNLAESVAPFIQSSGFVPSFFQQFKKANNTMYVNAKPPTDQRRPETMPTGSGNNDWCWWWSYEFYSQHDNTDYQYYEAPNKGEAYLYVADFDADASQNNTSVSSVTWEVTQGTATIANITTTGNASQALITFTNEGVVKIKARATYANSEIRDFDFLFNVNIKINDLRGS